MSRFPHDEFFVVIKGDVAFVKDKATGSTVGLFKNGHFCEYSNGAAKRKRERRNANGKGGSLC